MWNLSKSSLIYYYFYHFKKSLPLPHFSHCSLFRNIPGTFCIHRQTFRPSHFPCPCYCKYNLCCCVWSSLLQWGWIFQQAYQSCLFCDLLSSYHLGQGKNLIFLFLFLKVHLHFTSQNKQIKGQWWLFPNISIPLFCEPLCSNKLIHTLYMSLLPYIPSSCQ